MHLRTLLEYLDEARETGEVLDHSPVLMLVRNQDAGLDSEDAFEEIPVVDIKVDKPDIDLITDRSESRPGLTLSEFSSRLRGLPVEVTEYELFLRGDRDPVPRPWWHIGRRWWIRIDVPVVAAVTNPDRQVFGVVAKFEGYEKLFE